MRATWAIAPLAALAVAFGGVSAKADGGYLGPVIVGAAIGAAVGVIILSDGDHGRHGGHVVVGRDHRHGYRRGRGYKHGYGHGYGHRPNYGRRYGHGYSHGYVQRNTYYVQPRGDGGDPRYYRGGKTRGQYDHADTRGGGRVVIIEPDRRGRRD